MDKSKLSDNERLKSESDMKNAFENTLHISCVMLAHKAQIWFCFWCYIYLTGRTVSYASMKFIFSLKNSIWHECGCGRDAEFIPVHSKVLFWRFGIRDVTNLLYIHMSF